MYDIKFKELRQRFANLGFNVMAFDRLYNQDIDKIENFVKELEAHNEWLRTK